MMNKGAAFACIGVCVLVTSGCGSNNKDKIEGTCWSSQEHKSGTKVAVKGAIELDFGKDDRFEWRFGPEGKKATFKGAYRLGQRDNVTFEFDEEFEGSREHTEKIEVRD